MEPEVKKNISNQLDVMADNIAGLHASLDTLEGKLVPIMIQLSQGEAASQAIKGEDQSVILHNIDDKNIRIVQAQKRIQELIQRIQL